MYEPRLITPFTNSGLSQYFKPFIIGNTAFPTISNAYPWRGSVRKREGYELFKTIPGLGTPVRAIRSWINPSSLAYTSIVFDNHQVYRFNTGTQVYDNITFRAGAQHFNFGPDSATAAIPIPWTSNYAGSLWYANGFRRIPATEPAVVNGILFWNGTPASGWNNHQPQVDATPTYLNGALIILPYKGRLVVLNTLEGPQDGTSAPQQTFSNRARWSQLGTPYLTTTAAYIPPSPFNIPGAADDNAWRSDIPGRGGFNDADTSERIVSAEIVRDVLIVFFERSTWRLSYTGNELLPFIWERLNTQYGAESTFSNVGFDDAALAFSRYGWISSTTNDVQRIDQDIPDQSFAVEAGDDSFSGLANIQGIRDFYRQMAYWTYPPITEDQATQIYAYNYLDKNWSIFNPADPIRCFGYYFSNFDVTWGDLTDVTDKWQNYDDPINDQWRALSSGQNNGFPFILGGDDVGNLYKMFEFNGTPSDTDNGTSFNFNITTKQFNPYLERGHKCRLGYVDIYFSTSIGGEITVQHFVDEQYAPVFERKVNLYPVGVIDILLIVPGVTTTITTIQNHNLTTGVVANFSNIVGTIGNPINQNSFTVTVIDAFNFTIAVDTTGLVYVEGGYVWNAIFNPGAATYKRVYLGAIAHMHQLVLTLSEEQLEDVDAGSAQPEIQAMVIWTREMGLIRG